MEIRHFKAPSYRELRPLRALKDVTTGMFPGYQLVGKLVAAEFDPEHVPPTESGAFKHFGTEYQYKPRGDGGTWHLNAQPRKQLSSALELVANPLSFLARQVKLTRNLGHLGFHASIEDHLPQHCISALVQPNVQDEFGD
jgi:hypothetical protein